jgi:hypothetical protein
MSSMSVFPGGTRKLLPLERAPWLQGKIFTLGNSKGRGFSGARAYIKENRENNPDYTDHTDGIDKSRNFSPKVRYFA